MIKNYVTQLKSEFRNYSGADCMKDLMAGLTVAAVALPLALAFGVSSGSTAAAGLVTAIIAGLYDQPWILSVAVATNLKVT